MTAAGRVLCPGLGKVGWGIAGLLTFAGVLALGQDFWKARRMSTSIRADAVRRLAPASAGLSSACSRAALEAGLGELATTSRLSELIASWC